MKFAPTQAGSITGLQYYQGPKDSGITTATLWSANGKALATASVPVNRTVGWHTVRLAKPVAVTAGTSYVASYLATKGAYSVTQNALTTPRTSGGFSLPTNAGVFTYSKTNAQPTSTYKGSNYMADIVFSATGAAPAAPAQTPTTTATPRPTPTQTTTPTPVNTPTPTPTPTQTTAPTPPATAGGMTANGRSFPSPATTGVPAGTALTPYTGPCTIQTANTVIDAKAINCTLTIAAKGVVISRSQINGTVYSDSAGSGAFTISDSQVNVGNQAGTGIGDVNFTATRVNVTGGNRSINCYADCTVQDSYVSGQFTDKTGVYHESGIRYNTNSHLIHNTIACTAPDVAPDAGCSAAITGYPDFDPVTNDVIQDNLILAGSGGYCSYGGSTTGKPFSGQTANITFTGNVWQRGTQAGSNGAHVCGWWGPITSFDVKAPGAVWSNNMFDDGTPVAASN